MGLNMASTWHFPREDIRANPLKVGRGAGRGLEGGVEGRRKGDGGEEEEVAGAV